MELVDVYQVIFVIQASFVVIPTNHLILQVLAFVLKIPANPHNGTWSHVRGLLPGAEPGSAPDSSKAGLLLTSLLATANMLKLFVFSILDF